LLEFGIQVGADDLQHYNPARATPVVEGLPWEDMLCKTRTSVKAIFGLCASVALFGTVSSAIADMVTITFTGTASGYDFAGIFGDPKTLRGVSPKNRW
jgi:hypothetical protein